LLTGTWDFASSKWNFEFLRVWTLLVFIENVRLHGSHKNQGFIDASELDQAHPLLLSLLIARITVFTATSFVSLGERVVVGRGLSRFLLLPLHLDDPAAMLLCLMEKFVLILRDQLGQVKSIRRRVDRDWLLGSTIVSSCRREVIARSLRNRFFPITRPGIGQDDELLTLIMLFIFPISIHQRFIMWVKDPYLTFAIVQFILGLDCVFNLAELNQGTHFVSHIDNPNHFSKIDEDVIKVLRSVKTGNRSDE
jgi:hypothetical protein